MQGRSSFSIQWGAWAGIGMAANPALLRTLSWRGYGALQPKEGLAVLTIALTTLPSTNWARNSSPLLMASIFDWSTFLRSKAFLGSHFRVIQSQWENAISPCRPPFRLLMPPPPGFLCVRQNRTGVVPASHVGSYERFEEGDSKTVAVN